MFALPSFHLSSACTIEKESEVHVMWATQDELSNDVANYLFYFILIPPPPLQGLFLPQMDFIKQMQANYTPNHTKPFFFFLFLGVFFYLLNP
jgi:hypothetical protein